MNRKQPPLHALPGERRVSPAGKKRSREYVKRFLDARFQKLAQGASKEAPGREQPPRLLRRRG
eukprot:1409474-Prorocentrum_lima.AAC.1